MANAASVAAQPFSFAGLKYLFTEAWKEFNDDNAPRLGAALAYYTILSLAPLLVIIIAVAGLVFGQEAARGQISAQIQNLMGAQGAEMVETMIQKASNLGSGLVAGLIGLVTLLFGASSVMTELRNALNTVWDVPDKKDAGVTDMVKQRSYALLVVLGCGFLMLVSLVVSATIAAVEGYMANLIPLPEVLLQAINLVVSTAVIAVIFAFLFRFLPDIEIPWRDVLFGATFTAVLFVIGKFLIGLYLGKASFGSTYGAAGSLVIVLVWVYYSSQIFFFGAEVTQVYARVHGSDPSHRRQPAPAAQPAGPAPAPEMAAHAASGNAGVRADGRGPIGVLASAGMIAGLFAAAAREWTGRKQDKARQ